MYIQGGEDPRSMMGSISGDTQYDGAGLGENAHVSASDAYMALAAAKQAINAARAAAVTGNCGQTQELLGTAWAALMRYSQMAAAVGQPSTAALQLHKLLAKIETMSAMRCSQLQGAGPQAVTGDQACAGLPDGPGKDRCYKELVQQENAAGIQRNEAQQATYKRIAIGVGVAVVVGLVGWGIYAASKGGDE